VIQIKVIKQGELIFKGNILDIPIKDAYIIAKSIEIFDDDDPCIIHKSYVVKQFVDDLLKRVDREKDNVINLLPYREQLDYLDFDLENTVIYLEGK